ncbi:G1/S-specific cyclin-D2-like [Diadema antillarum]|uniref:G1/S-specific cyclin-D2-like n=1 Tax=Diadema antillarum TaxID=105358 RepID=UPI003A8B2E8E
MADLFCFEQDDQCLGRPPKSYVDTVLLKDKVLDNLLAVEDSYVLSADYFGRQTNYFQQELRPSMRKLVVDWMFEVCEEQQREEDVFWCAVNYMDRFLSMIRIRRCQFQLLGATCMFLASKLLETVPLTSEKLIIYTDHSITLEQLLSFEQLVLTKLKWDLMAITPNAFLEHILHRLPVDKEQAQLLRKHAQTFIVLCATDYSFAMQPPSLIAASSVAAAANGLRMLIPKVMDRLHRITKTETDYLILWRDRMEALLNKNLGPAAPKDVDHSAVTKTHTVEGEAEKPSTPTGVDEVEIVTSSMAQHHSPLC